MSWKMDAPWGGNKNGRDERRSRQSHGGNSEDEGDTTIEARESPEWTNGRLPRSKWHYPACYRLPGPRAGCTKSQKMHIIPTMASRSRPRRPVTALGSNREAWGLEFNSTLVSLMSPSRQSSCLRLLEKPKSGGDNICRRRQQHNYRISVGL